MTIRVIRGLRYAHKCQSPWTKRARLRGAKAQGVRYEHALARALPAMCHGQWFEFGDVNGKGHCQTDLLTDLGNSVLVLESKYTWTPDGQRQLDWLYRPVVERVWAKPMLGVVVCKTLVAEMPREVQVVGDLGAAIDAAWHGRTVVLHWLGNVPLSCGGIVPRPHHAPIDVGLIDA